MKKKIRNISVLDVRNITPELGSKLGLIKNIGTYITNDESELVLLDVEKKNVGSMIKTNEKLGLSTINGTANFSSEYFKSIEGRVLLTINGKGIVEKGVDPKLFLQKIHSGTVNGVMIIPSDISGVIKSHLAINGKVIEYDYDRTYISQTIELNDDFYFTYFGDKNVAVTTLLAIEPLDMNEFVNTFESIQVISQLVATRENIKLLKPYLKVDQNNIRLVEAPAHFEKGKVEFDQALSFRTADKNLIVDGQLTIKDTVYLDVLGDYKIQANKILCNKADYELVNSYCTKSNVDIRFVEDQPISNYSNLTINKEYLSHIKEKKVLENYGTVEFDLDINDLGNQAILLDIKNYGAIKVPDGIDQSIHELISENYGTINAEEKPSIKADDVLYENMGYLEL
ncbi:MAG: hypothetical protein JEZ08_17155 [Clostridiales bacterium]|nr:hypothetical protein [Clostridiales bacterium]